MVAKLTTLADSQNSNTTAPSGRELYYLQFLLWAVSPETFGYTLVFVHTKKCGLISTESFDGC